MEVRSCVVAVVLVEELEPESPSLVIFFIRGFGPAVVDSFEVAKVAKIQETTS